MALNRELTCMAMILSFILDLKVLGVSGRYVKGTMVFLVVLEISITLLHFVRNQGHEIESWKYAAYGFGLGVLFGPFGLLFRRCFPEVGVRNVEIRRTLFPRIAYGLLFDCALSAKVVMNMRRF